MEWTYAIGGKDITLDALRCSSDFTTWQTAFISGLKASPVVSGCNLVSSGPIVAGETRQVSCSFPSGPTLSVTVRAPATITASYPVIFVFDPWGSSDPASTLFVADGYITVQVKFQNWYTVLAPLYNNYGYLPVWGSVASSIANQVRTILPNHDGYSVVSSATGSLVAPYFVLWQSNKPRAVVTNGVLLSLDWLRRNYRYTTLPNIWDLGNVVSYTPVYLTMASIPTQWQMGTTDGFFPCPGPMISSDASFTGTPRGQTVDEVLGQYLVLEKAYRLLSTPIEMHLGEQGHLAVDYLAARTFVAAH